jgi:hypothetical protein
MADKIPIRAVYDNNNVASGLAEYQTGETVGVAHGGTGAVTFTNNRVLTGNTVAAIVDEANLTFDGSTLAVTGAATVSTTLGVTGVISPTTHVDMPDSANIKLGTGDDMQLYHDGTNSYITNSQGALKIATETSGIALTIGHTTSETTIADNLTVTGDAGIGGNLTVTGTSTFNGGTINLGDSASDTIAFGGTITGNLVFEGSSADEYELTLSPGNPTGDVTVTLPISTDTLVGKATTDTLTNKTLTSALITTNLSPTSADGAALGSATKEFSDLFLADAAVINLGADQDVTLTHVADTGVLLNSTRKIQFGDSASFIHQSADGVMTIDGEATIDLNASTAVLVSNDLKLNSDAAVLGLGADNDVTLTHVADTGLLLNSTMAIQFNDASQYINAPSNAILDINATDEIELNATLADVNANLDVSGTGTFGGILKTDATTAATTTTDGALQTDGGLSVAADAVIGDDLKLLSDAAVLSFGADSDVTLTHVADTGVLLNSTMAIQFNDASQYINAPSATVLDINATDEIELNATLADVNANLDVSGTYTGGGLMTTGGNIVIPDAGNIGSVGDTDSIAIDSSGNVTLSQNLTVTGDYTVNGTTTTISTTNMVVEDNLIELNNGASSNANDTGIVIERGSTGNNAIFMWDESADTFQVGTTTATGSSTGNLTVADAPFAAAAITASGVVTGTGFTIGSAVIDEADLEQIDDLTAGTVTASKALVVDGNKDIGTIRNLTIDGVFTDGNYTFDTSGNVSGLGTVGCGAITTSGNLAVTGTITGDTSLTLDSTTLTTAELGVLDSVTAGTVAASKAVVVDSNKDIGTFRNVTIDGTFSDGNYTFDTSGNVSGLGTISSGAITTSGGLTMTGSGTIIFEGATADEYETTLTVTDPTADRTVTLPNSTGILANQAYAQMIAIALG